MTQFARVEAIADTNPVCSNPVQAIGAAILIPQLFSVYSRIFEIRFASLHVTKILMALLLILAPASTRALKIVGDKYVGRNLLLFTMWTLAIIPFAVWRGGAYNQATQVWMPVVALFLVIACMLGTLPQIRRAFYTMAVALTFLAIASSARGSLRTGRLTLEHGLFGNPNELAMALLMGVPFLMFMVMEGGAIARILAFGGLFPVFWALLHTGSRGGFLGFLVVAIFLFFRCSAMGKLAVVIGGAGVLATAVLLLPPMTLARYLTMFEGNAPSVEAQLGNPEMGDPRLLAQAVGSANERKELLIYSIKLSFRHPITGVGMGNFETARNEDTKDRPYHVQWLGTHNAYTQISSETGLVGFTFYMAAFIGSIVLLRRIKKFAEAKVTPDSRTISRMVFCLQTSLVSYAVTSFFDHVAYQQIFPTLSGLTLALGLTLQPQLGEWLRRQKAAEPASAPDARPATVPASVQPAPGPRGLAARV